MSGNSTRITHNLKFDLCERIVHGNVPSISLGLYHFKLQNQFNFDFTPDTIESDKL